MERKKRLKTAVRILQVVILSGAFLFFFGGVASILYILGEIDVVVVVDYLLFMSNMEFGFIVFLEGLYYYTFKHGRKVKK